MKIIFRTKSGSTYVLDLEAQTWARVSKTEKSGPCRTEEGPMLDFYLVAEQRAVIHCPPVTEGSSGRMIVTSPVVSIESECKVYE